MFKRFSLRDWGHLVLAIFVCELAGVIGALFTTSEIPAWYAFLEKPFFTPPNWLFGPVWTLLYALMGGALFLGCRFGKPARAATTASYWFYVQLGVNILWSIVFFGFHNLWGGVVVIALLWVLVFITMRQYWRVYPLAGWLLLPYLAWISYATALNVGVAFLN